MDATEHDDPVEVTPEPEEDAAPQEAPPVDARDACEHARTLLRRIDESLAAGGSLEASGIPTAVGDLVDAALSDRTALLECASGTGDSGDGAYLVAHSVNVAIYSLALASLVDTERDFLEQVTCGALLHDVGLMSLGRGIVDKPGPLTREEWRYVREHPALGARMLAGAFGVDPAATVVALEHHIGVDGSGYPDRTPHRTPHLASRIVAIADAYDAMTSPRSYAPARPGDEAMAVLARNAEASYDPVLTGLFIGMLGIHPPGSVVGLEDGRTAVVVRPGSADPLKPVVEVTPDGAGAEEERVLLDLAEPGAPAIEYALEPSAPGTDADDRL